jgi:hypothetical protein
MHPKNLKGVKSGVFGAETCRILKREIIKYALLDRDLVYSPKLLYLRSKASFKHGNYDSDTAYFQTSRRQRAVESLMKVEVFRKSSLFCIQFTTTCNNSQIESFIICISVKVVQNWVRW